MVRDRIRTGRIAPVGQPEWESLRLAAETGLLPAFPWSFAVELDGGGRPQAYRHRDTRCYLHLDEGAGAWVYAGEERYREVHLEHALAAVLATWCRDADASVERRLGTGS